MTKGIRYQVGNGSNNSVFHNPWIPREYTSKPISHNPSAYNWTIADFIGQNGVWDTRKLTYLLFKEDVDAICTIPLRKAPSKDLWVWHYSKDGFYNVKSGYRLALTRKMHSPPQIFNIQAPFGKNLEDKESR